MQMSKGIVQQDNTAVAAGAALMDVFGGKIASRVTEKVLGPALRNIVAAGIDEVANGVSVLGPRATYREFTQKIGANFLNVTDEGWTMRKNVEFLQGCVKRGDDVIFFGKYNPVRLDPNSVLAQEIQYLTKRGYVWTDDFSRFKKKIILYGTKFYKKLHQ